MEKMLKLFTMERKGITSRIYAFKVLLFQYLQKSVWKDVAEVEVCCSMAGLWIWDEGFSFQCVWVVYLTIIGSQTSRCVTKSCSYVLVLKGLNVTFRKCLLTITPVAVKSTAVGVLSIDQNSDMTHTRLKVIDRHHVDRLLFNKNIDGFLASFMNRCLSSRATLAGWKCSRWVN